MAIAHLHLDCTRWPARLLLSGVALVVAITAIALAAEPQALRTPGAVLLLPAMVVLVALYAVTGVVALRHPGPGDTLGAAFGLAAGAMWCVEIFGGGPARLSRPAEVAVGLTFSLAAVGFSLAAGPIASRRHRTWRAAVRAGTFAGLVSGVVVFIFGVGMTLLTLDLLGSRGDYQAQLAHSQAPSMPAFLVQDILAATCAHLVINAVLGLAGAGLATLHPAATSVARRRRTSAE